jgi:hypothetical protein
MIAIRPFTQEWAGAVRDFNWRIASSGFLFPGEADPNYFIAVDGDAVRGGYVLRHQKFWFHGEPRDVAHYQLPLSEGIVNKAYVSLGMQLLRHALKQQPMLYALGMGGLTNALPRMLTAMGWGLWEVPFLFKVNRAGAFLRNIQPLRKTALRRMAMDLAAYSGLGWVGLRALQRPLQGVSAGEVVDSFAGWGDDVWSGCSAGYGALAGRDAGTLDAFYDQRNIIRLKVGSAGWAAVLDTQMQDHKYFGGMRVGSIADCLAAAGDAPMVVGAAVRFLEQRGVDLIVSNQLHAAWVAALRGAGLRVGPSNFVFAASKKLSELIPNGDEAHINRGDGDGPIHL